MPEGERVRLTFTSFDLDPEVCGDFVQVFDSVSIGKRDMSLICTEGKKIPLTVYDNE